MPNLGQSIIQSSTFTISGDDYEQLVYEQAAYIMRDTMCHNLTVDVLPAFPKKIEQAFRWSFLFRKDETTGRGNLLASVPSSRSFGVIKENDYLGRKIATQWQTRTVYAYCWSYIIHTDDDGDDTVIAYLADSISKTRLVDPSTLLTVAGAGDEEWAQTMETLNLLYTPQAAGYPSLLPFDRAHKFGKPLG